MTNFSLLDVEDDPYHFIRKFIDDYCELGNAMYLPRFLFDDELYDRIGEAKDVFMVSDVGLLANGDRLPDSLKQEFVQRFYRGSLLPSKKIEFA